MQLLSVTIWSRTQRIYYCSLYACKCMITHINNMHRFVVMVLRWQPLLRFTLLNYQLQVRARQLLYSCHLVTAEATYNKLCRSASHNKVASLLLSLASESDSNCCQIGHMPSKTGHNCSSGSGLQPAQPPPTHNLLMNYTCSQNNRQLCSQSQCKFTAPLPQKAGALC